MRPLFCACLFIFISTTACRPSPSQTGGDGSCVEDTDCRDTTAPFCSSEGECVPCETADHCDCHEGCVENTCQPMGAQTTSQTLNAHGNWQGTPGTDNYRFDSLCESDAECGIGQLCNPLTSGCVQAALFTSSCSADADCDAGPNGEALACEPNTQLCLPTARCEATSNCCGAEGFVCDTAAQICKDPASECTPPETVTNECPFEPRVQDTCDPGYFCSPVGECVQCLCDDDCTTGQRCYMATQTCKAADYCESDGECTEPGQVCDEDRETCTAYCDESNATTVCGSEEYCDLDANVCRPLSELPCTPDQYAPNQGADTAASLTLPAMDESRTETELSLCDEEQDWFTVSLSAGDELTVTMTSAAGLTASYVILAADGLTQLASGTLGPLGSELLRFTASRTDEYYLRITRSGSETGFYSLTLSLAQGESCVDPAEPSQGNDSGTTASLLFAPETTIEDGCSRTAIAGNEIIYCPPSELTLCDGDVDYYRIELSGGSQLQVTLSSFGGDLDLDLYGPFEQASDFDPNALLNASTDTAPQKTVATIARSHSYYVARVYRDFGDETGYSIEVEIDPPPSACIEDSYEESTLNDTMATAASVSLSTDNTTELALNLCIGDVEWLALGANGSETIPANHRLTLTMNLDSTVNQGTLAAGLSPDELTEAAGNTLSLTQTENATYWVRIVADQANPAHQPITLSAALAAPPACTSDDNLAPSSAVSLTSLSTANDVEEAPSASSCPDDDDWYRVAVPEGLDLTVVAEYDPSEVNLGLSIYDASVAAISEDTHANPPTAGLLSQQGESAQSFQLIRESAGDARDVYIRVSNESGWTLDSYELSARLVDPSCTDDAHEANDSAEAASALSLSRQSFGEQLDQTLMWDLSSCAGNEDWFSLRLLPGDALHSALAFDSAQASLTLSLYEEGTDSPIATSDGTSPLAHTLLEDGNAGQYLMQVSPQSGQAPDYALSVLVERACEDDSLEPVPPATETALTAPLDHSELVLCSDEDSYNITSSAANLTVCVLFEHDAGDIDLELLSEPNGSVLDSSLTKNDVESVSVNPNESTTYFLRIFLDSRDSGAVNYRLVAGENLNCESL